MVNEDDKTEISARIHSSQIVLPCPNLSEALDFFTERLGFRIEMIVPADSPRAAVISGHGVTLRLEAETDSAATAAIPLVDLSDSADEYIVIHRIANDTWNIGRAGMQYRDLIPGRLGGRFIASHIRIPDGGEIPDYVHFHKVRFQMIYCKEGWARLVYQDQGPSFILQAGDCLLQPPEIRHRVLETSSGLEVIEIACPAIHETHADYDLQLPTSWVLPERLYADQRFVVDRVNDAKWMPWIEDGFEVRDAGIAAATNGLATARVIRSTGSSGRFELQHSGEFLFLFVLAGKMALGSIEDPLAEGDSCVLHAGLKYTLETSAGFEILEVRLPAGASNQYRERQD
jgi:mannose-6-phosphate isomerase-like protein (cupin superfamily)